MKIKDHDEVLSKKCREIIPCDTARISKVGDKLFLLIGFNRSTKDDKDSFAHNGDGVRIDWDYVEEHCVAYGNTEEELIDSAKEYQRLCGMTMEEYLKELVKA